MTPQLCRALRPLEARVRGGLRARAEAQSSAAHSRVVARPVAVRSQAVGAVLQHVHQRCLDVMERYSKVRAALRALKENTHTHTHTHTRSLEMIWVLSKSAVQQCTNACWFVPCGFIHSLELREQN